MSRSAHGPRYLTGVVYIVHKVFSVSCCSVPFNGREYLENKQHEHLDIDGADLRGATRCRGALGSVREAWSALKGLARTTTSSASPPKTKSALARAVEMRSCSECARCDDVLLRKYVIVRVHMKASNSLSNKVKSCVAMEPRHGVRVRSMDRQSTGLCTCAVCVVTGGAHGRR